MVKQLVVSSKMLNAYIAFYLKSTATILDKIVGTLSNLMSKFHVPCKNVVHPPSPLLNVAVGEKIFVHVQRFTSLAFRDLRLVSQGLLTRIVDRSNVNATIASGILYLMIFSAVKFFLTYPIHVKRQVVRLGRLWRYFD